MLTWCFWTSRLLLNSSLYCLDLSWLLQVLWVFDYYQKYILALTFCIFTLSAAQWNCWNDFCTPCHCKTWIFIPHMPPCLCTEHLSRSGRWFAQHLLYLDQNHIWLLLAPLIEGYKWEEKNRVWVNTFLLSALSSPSFSVFGCALLLVSLFFEPVPANLLQRKACAKVCRWHCYIQYFAWKATVLWARV